MSVTKAISTRPLMTEVPGSEQVKKAAEKPHEKMQTKISDLCKTVFEGTVDLSKKQKYEFFASWWDCWSFFGGARYDHERQIPAEVLLKNPKLLESRLRRTIHALPTLTPDDFAHIVSFLSAMSPYSKTLAKEMDGLRSLVPSDEKVATREGRALHLWLYKNVSEIQAELPGNLLCLRDDGKGFSITSEDGAKSEVCVECSECMTEVVQAAVERFIRVDVPFK